MDMSANECFLVMEAIDVKLASLRRGMNSARSPSFKEVYESEIAAYNAVRTKIEKEYHSGGSTKEDNQAKK